MKYILSKEAIYDVENIWFYTFEKWSVEQADRYFNLLMNEIDYLTEYPKSGKDYNEIRKGYYRAKVKSEWEGYRYI